MAVHYLWSLGCIVREGQDVTTRLTQATQEFCSQADNAAFVPHVQQAIQQAAATFSGPLPQAVYVTGAYASTGELLDTPVRFEAVNGD